MRLGQSDLSNDSDNFSSQIPVPRGSNEIVPYHIGVLFVFEFLKEHFPTAMVGHFEETPNM